MNRANLLDHIEIYTPSTKWVTTKAKLLQLVSSKMDLQWPNDKILDHLQKRGLNRSFAKSLLLDAIHARR